MLHKFIFMSAPPIRVFKQLIDDEHSTDQNDKSSYILVFLKRGEAEKKLRANDYAFLNPLFKNEDLDVYKHIFEQRGTEAFIFFHSNEIKIRTF